MSNVEGGNKQLKITIAVDNQALDQFKRAIREATSEVSKLVEALNKGSKISSLLGAVSSKGGGAGSGSQQRVSGGGNGGSITSPTEAIANAIRGAAKGSTDALKQMESGLRSSVGKQVQDVKTLERAIDSLGNKYKNMATGIQSLDPFQAHAGSGAGRGGASQRYLGAGGGGQFAFAPTMAEQIAANDPFQNSGGGGSRFPKGPGFFDRMRDRMRGMFSEEGGVDDLIKAARKALPFYMAGKGTSMILGQSIAAHDDFNKQAVPLAGAYSSRGLDMMYGRDYTTLYNLMQIKQGDQGEGRNAKHQDRSRADVYFEKKAKFHGWKPGTAEYDQQKRYARAAFENDSKDNRISRAGESDFDGASGFVRGAKSLIDSTMSLDPNILRNLAGVDTAEKLRKLAMGDQKGQINAADPFNRGLKLYTNQWESMLGASRQLGLGDSVWKTNANLRAQGFDLGALGAGQGSVMGAGGWQMARKYGDLAMRGQAGKVGNIGEFLGLASQGTGNAGQSARFLAGTGLDPGAQAAMANTLMMHMGGGSTMGSPDGLMAALASGGSFGGRGDSGEQMRVQAGMGQGMQGLNRDLFGGGMDNLQKGRNIVNALDATGGNLFGSQYLAEKMNMGMLADLRSGKASPAILRKLKSLGISKEQALAYGQSTVSTMFRNVGLDKGAMGDMARDIMGNFGGDASKYFKANRGKKGFDSKQALTTFASILQSENPDMTDQDAEGRARDLIGLGDPSKLKPGHFHDAAGKKMLRSAKNRGKFEKEDAQNVDKITDDIIDKSHEAGQKVADLGKDIGKSAEEVGQSLMNLADQVDVITLRLAKAADRVEH